MPQAVLPVTEVHSVTVAKQQSLVAAPVAEYPRDAQIDVLEKALQSLQSTLEKLQTATASASLQQPPPATATHRALSFPAVCFTCSTESS